MRRRPFMRWEHASCLRVRNRKAGGPRAPVKVRQEQVVVRADLALHVCGLAHAWWRCPVALQVYRTRAVWFGVKQAGGVRAFLATRLRKQGQHLVGGKTPKEKTEPR